MQPQLQIEQFNHVALPTRRLDESRQFYIDVLGAKLISRPNFSFRGAWLYIGGIQIHLIEDEVAPHPTGVINSRDRHIAFPVADIEATEEFLKQRGIPYKRGSIADRNIPQIYIQDPDGHTIELGSKYWKIDE